VLSTVNRLFPVLLVALVLIGVGTSVNLQARFAATDVSTDAHRATDLSLVVWATTVGAVSGPNLIGPGDAFGLWLGLPELAGPFVLTLLAQLGAGVLYRSALRPEPLELARQIAQQAPDDERIAAVGDDRPADRVTALISIALSHATMVAVMAMTPVHLVDHGASLVIVGFTISLHIAGMYALSPVFGILADRIGRKVTILVGQLMLAVSLLATGFGAESEGWVIAGLILLGTGWSAATVAGSALLTESTPVARRTRIQGLSDVLMSAAGATGGALSGVVLLLLGYSGLSLVSLVLVAIVTLRVITRWTAPTKEEAA
jgi:MFS family permease